MNKLTKNMFYQTSYQILVILVSVITTPIITRTLGDVGLGQYSYTCAIVNYFAIFASLGINNYGVREIARAKIYKDRDSLNKVFWSIYSLQIILSLIAIIAYYTYVVAFVEKYKLLAIIQGMVLLNNLTDVSWFFFGIEQFKITVTRNIAVKLISLIIIIFCIKVPGDIYLYAFTLAGGVVISNMVLLIDIRKYVSFFRVTFFDIFKHLKPNVILFIPVISASIFVYMDKIMLGYIAGPVQNGYYEVMERIISVPFACISALTTVMYPRISSLLKQGNGEITIEYLKISLIGISFFSMACFWGMLGVADIFVPLFLGEKFAPAQNVVILGCLVLLPRGIREVVKTEYLLPKSMDKKFTIVIISGAACNLFANILLIPAYGAVGAVLATIFSDMVACGLVLFFSRKEVSYILLFAFNIPFLIFGLIMFLIIQALRGMIVLNDILKLILLVMTGGMLYIALCTIYLFSMRKLKKEGLGKWRKRYHEN